MRIVFSIRIIMMVILLVGFNLTRAWSADEEALGRQAEEAGKLREALTHYVATLQDAPQGSDAELRWRERIIKLVQNIQPPPAIPEDARKFAVRGQTAVREAKSASDFQEATKEFKKALRIAPWWADGYFNLGVAQEKAGQLNEAIRSLKLYLLAAPDATDGRKVQDQIYAIEYHQEKVREEMAEQQTAKKKIQSLSGTWYKKDKNSRFQITVTGNTIEIVHSHLYFNGQWWDQKRNSDVWQGTVKGSNIEGSWSRNWASSYRNGRIFTGPMKGTISPESDTIRLKFTGVVPAGATGDIANGWMNLDQEIELIRDF